ncbi:predicted protein [Postia placenta Mad-698-R]|nr:predicted protein [Postia placenta Mad-698-R]
MELECIEDELLPTLSDVRMSINAQRPVNRLPDKILSEIFRQVPPSPLALYINGLCISLRKFLVWESFFDFKDTGCDFDLPASYAHGLQALAAWNCVLQGDVSNLKALVLRAVDWHLPSSLTNLTHLYLVRKRLRVVDLFRILSIALRIEDLVLEEFSAEDALDPHEDIPAVALQHLRRLAIHRPDRNLVSALFSHVCLPMRLAASFELCQALDFEWLVPLTQIDTNALYISASTYSVVAAGPSRAVRFSCRHDLEVMVPWTMALLSHFHLQFKDLWIASTHRELDMTILKRTPWVERLHIGSSRYTTMLETLGNKPAYWPKLTKVATLQHSRLLKFAETRAHLGRPLEELECHASRSTYIQDLERIESHVGVVRLVKDDPFALPLPDVCTDGVPSPYFWPEEWDELYFSSVNVNIMTY